MRRSGRTPVSTTPRRPTGMHGFIATLSEPAVVVRASTSEIALINEEAAALFGYAAKDLIGRSIEVLMPERFRVPHTTRITDTDVRPRTRRMAERTEVIGLRRDGSEFPIEITLSPTRTRSGSFVTAIVRDVTASRLTTDALATTEARLKTIVFAMSEGIVMVYDDGSVEACNRAAMDMMGFSSADNTAPGFPAGWVFLGEDGTPIDGSDAPGKNSIATGAAFEGMIVGLQRPERSPAWFGVNSHPLFEPGTAAPYAAVVTFTDVTERRLASVALRTSEEFLRLRTRQLERANSDI